MLLNPLIFWRRYPDLNQGITVLQTVALTLGHTTFRRSVHANIITTNQRITLRKSQIPCHCVIHFKHHIKLENLSSSSDDPNETLF